VIGHCIYAVDMNPMAVELAKVALWMEAMEPGKPLSFLDHHIVCGNSLLGVTPKLLEQGIPDDAFVALTGDDKEVVKTLKARNRNERKKSLLALTFGDSQEQTLRDTADELLAIDHLDDQRVADVVEKSRRYAALLESRDHKALRLAADAWVAAFVGAKTRASPEITAAVVNASLSDPDTVPQALAAEIKHLADRFRFHHWQLVFPDVFAAEGREDERTGWSGGFDLVLGNPPWERVKLQEKEFFASSAPEIAKAPNKAARTRLINALKSEDPGLWDRFQDAVHDAEAISHFLRTSGVYPLCGRGDVNTYAVFAEQMRSITGPTGRAGVIVPTGLATDDTTKHFFSDLVDRRSLVSLFGFYDRKQIFQAADVHGFCLLTLSGSDRAIEEPEFVFFARSIAEMHDPTRRFTLTAEDFALLNPNTRTCPIFRSKRDAEITKGIYRRVPVLINRTRENGNLWNVSLSAMFHMSNDSNLFVDKAPGANDHVLLYEGKMIHLYDHRFASFNGDEFVDVPETRKEYSTFVSAARYAVPRDEFERRYASLGGPPLLLGFRNIGRSTDSRSFIVSAIPATAAGNNLPLLVIRDAEQAMLLLGILSSYALDYCARQKVGGTTLNFFIVEQFPVLLPKVMDQPCAWDTSARLRDWLLPRLSELVFTANDLRNPTTGVVYSYVSARRPFVRAEVDAALFYLYGLEKADLEYVMETFHVVRDREVTAFGSYRTKELILEVFKNMAKAIETGEPYETILSPPPADPSLHHPAEEFI
jgi:hypothetical protein